MPDCSDEGPQFLQSENEEKDYRRRSQLIVAECDEKFTAHYLGVFFTQRAHHLRIGVFGQSRAAADASRVEERVCHISLRK
jgi:hypothetical protein